MGPELTQALDLGMTPIVSYWSAPDMQWMDGLGSSYQGPCATDNPGTCDESVRFNNFSVEDGAKRLPSPPLTPLSSVCSAAADNCIGSKCCSDPGFQCYQKNSFWAQC